jgi:energy-coupling factor transport system substrate-specific component
VLAAAAATVIAAVIGVIATGTFNTRPGPGEIPVGSNLFMLVLAVALLIGFGVYAAFEWAQTRRFDSIARQFDTRTIVLIPFAIAINIVLGQTVGTALKLPVYLDSIGTILVGVLAGPLAGAATGLLSNLAWTFVLAGTPFGSPFAWPFAIVAAEIGLLAGVFGYIGVFRPRPNSSRPDLVLGIVLMVVVLYEIARFSVLPFYRNLCGPDAPVGTSSGQLCFDPFGSPSGGPVDPLFALLAYGVAAIVVLGIVTVLVRLVRARDLGVALVIVAGAACGVVSAFIAAPIAALVFGGVTGSGTDLLVAAFKAAGSDLQQAVLQQSLISDPIDKTVTFVLVFTILGSLSRRITARFPQGERALGTVEG